MISTQGPQDHGKEFLSSRPRFLVELSEREAGRVKSLMTADQIHPRTR